MINIKVSIVIPVYNTEAYLKECLNSLVEQTYPNIEIICINDGSTDNSGEILNNYEKRYSNIKVINQENTGLSGARNTGIKNSQGDFLFFLDSDDFLSNKYIVEELLKHAITDQLDIVVGDYICYYDKNKNVPYKHNIEMYNMVMSGSELLNIGIRNNTINSVVWNKLYKRECIQDELFLEGLLYEDMEYTLRVLSKCNRVKLINCNTVNYRQRDSSIMNSAVSLKKGLDYIKIAKEIVKQCYSTKNNEIFSTWVSICLIKAIKIAIQLGTMERKIIVKEIQTIDNLGEVLSKNIFLKHKFFTAALHIYLRSTKKGK
ncbi:glycosyltransferase family 2 protein [Priestia megaterium]|uniref:glycosyltransferase family 2 protein n=1 Tax=Priestia megaterium TaxID=1404 RepID=UPI002E1E9BAE|nr:glycosyltransferase [Priestia megaterium]